MKTWELFEAVYSGELLNEVDIYNEVELITDQFEQNKLQLLCDDFDRFLISKRNEKYGSQVELLLKKERGDINEKEYFKRLSELKKPIIFIDDHFNDSGELEKKLAERAKHKLSNDGCLSEFYLSALKGLLIDLKRKHIDKESEIKNIQPINWLKREESLRQFLDIIKSAGLIENRVIDEIIQEHFRQTDKKPQPIQWSKSNRLLIYLFNRLTEAGLIDTMDRQFKLITEHFLDRHGKQFKRDSLKQDFQNMKYSSDPRGANTIDKIIQELTD